MAVCLVHCTCWSSAVDPCPKHGTLAEHALSLRLRLDTDRNSTPRARLYSELMDFGRQMQKEAQS